MRIEDFEFGRIRIDGVDYEYDLVIEAGRVRKRKKGPSKPRRDEFSHTPLTASEKVPWQAKRLWVGTGVHGMLPVTEDFRREARRRGVELLLARTPDLITRINESLPPGTNVILHITC